MQIVLYGFSKEIDPNCVRSEMFQSRYTTKSRDALSTAPNVSIDMSLLPPCSSSLRKHYQAFIWRNANVQYPVLPAADGNGWCLDDVMSEICKLNGQTVTSCHRTLLTSLLSPWSRLAQMQKTGCHKKLKRMMQSTILLMFFV